MACSDAAFVRWTRASGLRPAPVRAFLTAREHLSLALGEALAIARQMPDPLQQLHARVRELESRTVELRQWAEIVSDRLGSVPPRHRPHYRPEARFRVLEHMKAYGLTVEQTAARFQVTSQTIHNWLHEAASHPDAAVIGRLLHPVPPLRRFADVVRCLVQRMSEAGFGGHRKTAATLARAAWRVSPSFVRRVRREKPMPSPPAPLPAGPHVSARYPNHVWMADLTDVPAFFRLLRFKVAVVLDVFSRMPLAAAVFPQEPSAADMDVLLRRAIALHGAPRHFVSDQGQQFRARQVRRTLRSFGVRHRFGAVGRVGSIAVIERFWRTLKESWDGILLGPLLAADLQRTLDLALVHYAYLRPHQALAGSRPAEVYFGIRPSEAPGPPPRGRPGERVQAPEVLIAHLDPPRRLFPFLLAA